MQRNIQTNIYAGREPAELAACSMLEAALWLDVPLGTVRDWTVGRQRDSASGRSSTDPVIQIADPNLDLVSFTNLTELFVLKSLRDERVSLPRIRRGVTYLKERLAIPHPLASKQMLTDGTDILIEHVFDNREELVNASRGGQLEMKAIVLEYLQRIERNHNGAPLRLYPFTRTSRSDAPRAVMIDPRYQFCRPCLTDTRIPTSAIAERWKAGESIIELAADFGRPLEDVEEAIRFENPTHRAA